MVLGVGHCVGVSALTGQGVEGLLAAVVKVCVFWGGAG